MCRLTVSSCCCFSLKTGGYIIGFIDLFFHIVRFVYFQEFRFHADYRLVLDIFSLVMCASWIYGIYAKNRHFMLPYLILIIFTVFSLILLVIFLFTTPHYDYYKTARMKQILRDSGLLIHNDLFVIKIVYTFAAVIGWFVTLIMYSLYKSLKQPFDASNMQCEFYNIT